MCVKHVYNRDYLYMLSTNCPQDDMCPVNLSTCFKMNADDYSHEVRNVHKNFKMKKTTNVGLLIVSYFRTCPIKRKMLACHTIMIMYRTGESNCLQNKESKLVSHNTVGQ